MRKLITLLSVLMMYSIVAMAQSKPITGKITGSDGQPIEGASVRIQGTKVGTVTNAKGEFKLNAKDGTTLLVSAVAFSATKLVVSSSQDHYTIVLTQAVSSMDEVVVTAGGLKSRKKEQSYNATDIKSDELIATKPVDVTASLAGKVAGLEVSDV